MLLNFKMRNYKSFAEETVFSMVAAPKQKGLDYSLMSQKIKKTNNGKIEQKTIKGLCSSVIYGPNAAGKTNIIGAMDFLRDIVLRGNIRNPEKPFSPNYALFFLESIPNNKLSEPHPVELSIDFFESGLLINYAVSLDLGSFLDEKYKRKIIGEELTINGENIFNRKEGKNLTFDNLKSIEKYNLKSFQQNEQSFINAARESLDSEELLLTNGFKLAVSKSLIEIITNWFDNKFTLIYQADKMNLTFGGKIENLQEKQFYMNYYVDKAIKQFGVNSNELGYNNKSELYSLIGGIDDKEGGPALKAELFESYGTIRFINLFPLIIEAIKNGKTLVIDEFDASVHPMALMSIINIFHNDDINKKHAQLIFNTHNPIFLNSNIFRRDEIKFVERDDETSFSSLYSLADFSEKRVRKHEDYMKYYFISRYGAIKDIDFTPIFEEMLENDKEV